VHPHRRGNDCPGRRPDLTRSRLAVTASEGMRL
jgi:hypothetical protein